MCPASRRPLNQYLYHLQRPQAPSTLLQQQIHSGKAGQTRSTQSQDREAGAARVVNQEIGEDTVAGVVQQEDDLSTLWNFPTSIVVTILRLYDYVCMDNLDGRMFDYRDTLLRAMEFRMGGKYQ